MDRELEIAVNIGHRRLEILRKQLCKIFLVFILSLLLLVWDKLGDRRVIVLSLGGGLRRLLELVNNLAEEVYWRTDSECLRD